jgi:hypothetical protein
MKCGNDNDGSSKETASSCDVSLSRAEFIAKILKRGAIAGAILAAPAVIDRFVVPPAVAAGTMSTTTPEGHETIMTMGA